MADSPIKVGGAYVESDDHVPNPTDMVAQFNTSGTGAHGKIEEVAPVFKVDKVKAAQEALAALDPKNTSVPSDRVLLPSPLDDNEAAKKDLTERAKATVKEGVVIGGPTPAEQEAELEGDEGVDAAVEQERGNAASNSTGHRSAGTHTGDANTDNAEKTAAKKTASSGTAKKAASSGSSTKASDKDDKDDKGGDAAKKTASSGGTTGSSKSEEQPA